MVSKAALPNRPSRKRNSIIDDVRSLSEPKPISATQPSPPSPTHSDPRCLWSKSSPIAEDDQSLATPRIPKVGERVVVKGGTVETSAVEEFLVGFVRYVGKTVFSPGDWVGVALDGPWGKNNGSAMGVQYFRCLPNHGVFVQPQGVVAQGKEAVEEFLKKQDSKLRVKSRAGAARRVFEVVPGQNLPQWTRGPEVGLRVHIMVNGKRCGGEIRFVGETKFAKGVWVGIALEAKLGKHDGTVAGQMYFEAKPGRGIFVRPEAVIMKPECFPDASDSEGESDAGLEKTEWDDMTGDELREQILKLRSQIHSMHDRIHDLESKNDELERANQELEFGALFGRGLFMRSSGAGTDEEDRSPTPVEIWSAPPSDSDGQAFRLATESLESLDFKPDIHMFDIDFYEGTRLKENLQLYYQICKGSQELLVTTSCFSAWNKAGKKNGTAKVIPAVPAAYVSGDGNDNVRVFFFDDNINLHLGGSHDVDGVCNLRDIETGEYVDFSQGQNGFVCSYEFKNTCVHHSTEYRVVLVQANIMDAMANLHYFTSLVTKYASEGEKLIIYMDVNGTVYYNDTICNKGKADLLLSTMFRFAEVRPRSEKGYEFAFGGKPAIRTNKIEPLKQLVAAISNQDNKFYTSFWCLDTCRQFITELTLHADIAWKEEEELLSCDDFFRVYQENLDNLTQRSTIDGITKSWFELYETMIEAGHAVIVNSFGVDALKVVRKSVRDERDVLQLTVNYGIWGKRDSDAWHAQFPSY